MRLPRLLADPNPVPAGLGLGATVLAWDTQSGEPGVLRWLAPGEPERILAVGTRGSVSVEPIIVGNVYFARLYLEEHDVPAAELAVTRNFWPRGRRQDVDALVGIDALTPRLGSVDFGSLRRLTPISREFGFDRGQPIDRYYIESFLEKWRADIRGRVLEVQDDSYTSYFGAGRVTQSDILDVDSSNPRASILADLNDPVSLPANIFDCVILSQTLQLIQRPDNALRAIYRALKPQGVLLATFPGISHMSREDAWYWRFTARSASDLFAAAFGSSAVRITTFGNVLSSCAFLQGLSAWEVDASELDQTDPLYDLVIGVRAQRSEALT